MNEDKLLNYIQDEIIDPDLNIQIESHDNLLGDNIIDSMGIMKLISYIEDLCQINIPPQDMIIENFNNVSAIINYINSRS